MVELAYPEFPVLLVEDDADVLFGYEMSLRESGIENIVTATGGEHAIEIVDRQIVDAVLLDVAMPRVSGMDVLRHLREERPDVPVVMISGVDDVATAVQCMRDGATDFLVKPVEHEQLVATIRRAIDVQELRRENRQLRESLLSGGEQQEGDFGPILTRSPEIMAILRYLKLVAPTRHPVLITGETGVGKDLVARYIHSMSGRDGRFVSVNAAGLDPHLFSDTLFGHVKGAFTGATTHRQGLIDQAENGTLFLDEIGDLDIGSQVKLLRVVQEGEYYQLGSEAVSRSNARIVVATNRDLDVIQRSGSFRKDLFYRLTTHAVHIPPLRDRPEDVRPLLDHFLQLAAREMGKPVPTYPRELPVLLQAYHFPGNVRELQSLVFDAVARHPGRVLSTQSFRRVIDQRRAQVAAADEVAEGAAEPWDAPIQIPNSGPFPTLAAVEQYLVDEAMRRADGNRVIAAELLGLSRQALQRRLKKQHD